MRNTREHFPTDFRVNVSDSGDDSTHAPCHLLIPEATLVVQ